MGSWMAGMGTSLPLIAKTLGHQSLEATKIYARLEDSPVRAAMLSATDAMRIGSLDGLVTSQKISRISTKKI
jgi:hypothetical protein